VAKVAQSATVTWRTTCQISWDVGSGTFFQIIFFLLGCNSNFFFTGTKIIFKPFLLYHCCHWKR